MLKHTDTSKIIEKWYKTLGFPKELDREFYQALQIYSIPADTRIETYPYDTMGGKWDLLAFLYMCEQTEKDYAAKGISRDILLDTLSDIVLWCREWSALKGELYLGETGWLACHISSRLFKLGRLQFGIETVPEKFAKYGMHPGGNYISVHIPATGPLYIPSCEASFSQAREFFAKHFPNVKYSYFSCSSWLLDDTLKDFLPENSNIIRFASLFEPVDRKETDEIMRYIFGMDTTRENLQGCQCRSDFARHIQQALLSGQTFFSVRGLRKA